MSYISSITQGLTDFARKNLAKFDGLTDQALKGTAESLDEAIENSSRILEQMSPEDAHLLEKDFTNFSRHGISQGEIKQLIQKFPEFVEKIEILADKKLIDSILGRQGISKEHFSQILCNVTAENKAAVIKILKDKELSNEQLAKITHLVTDESVPVLQQALKNGEIDIELLQELPASHFRIDKIELLKAISKKENISYQNILYIMATTTTENSEIALKMLQKTDTVNGSFSSILLKLQKPLQETEESLKIHEAQKKFFSELLDNPEFKLPEDELEGYRLSKVINAVTPENIDIAQKAILRGVKAYNLDEFTKGITKENKALASRILDLVEGEIELPTLDLLEPQHLEKYLDKVEKISNPEARKYYIEALGYLVDSNTDKILSLIKQTESITEAKHAAALIQSLSRGIENIDEIEPVIKLIEKSGRQLHNSTLVNLAVLSKGLDSDILDFFKNTLNNPRIHDYDLESYLLAYTKQVEDAKKTIQLYLSNSFNTGEISKEEFIKRFGNIDAETSKYLQEVRTLLDTLTKNEGLSQHEVLDIFRKTKIGNIDILKTYAASPTIRKIDPSAIDTSTKIEDVEAILKMDISKSAQRNILPIIKTGKDGAEKRLEIVQKLTQREVSSDKIAKIIRSLNDETMKYIDDILARTDFDDKAISFLIEQIKNGKGKIVKELLQNPKIKQEYLEDIIRNEKLIMPEYKANPEKIISALEHKLPLIHYELLCEDKLVSEILGEKRYTQILKGLQTVKAQYGIEPKETLSLCLDAKAHSNDLFIILKDNHVTYKFNKKSGKLISVQTENETINFRTNTRVSDSVSSEGKLTIDNDVSDVPYHIETVQKGKKGTLRTTYTESGIKGQYDIYHTKPDGSRIKVGRAQVTPNGAQHVSRTLTGLNGHKTSLSYRKDAAGNTYFHSVIKNKSGEIISEITRKRTVISENHFITSLNDQAFDIIFTNDKVIVTKLDSAGKKTKAVVEYAIKDIPVDTADKVASKIMNFEEDEIYKVAEVFQQHGIKPRTIDRRCIPMLKELPGDEWFAIDKSVEFVMPQTIEGDIQAFYAGNSIFVGKQHMSNLGVYCHELGHAKFYTLGLAKDPKLQKIYNAEKELYTSTFPESRVKSIEYFLEGNQQNMKGLNEACAETNLISDTIQSWDQIQDRTIFFEQYFPETIAYIRRKYAELI